MVMSRPFIDVAHLPAKTPLRWVEFRPLAMGTDKKKAGQGPPSGFMSGRNTD